MSDLTARDFSRLQRLPTIALTRVKGHHHGFERFLSIRDLFVRVIRCKPPLHV